MPAVKKDFKEFIELLIARRVKFIIVGAYALAYHGIPRFTGDIDILVKPDPLNAGRIIKALDDFGFGKTGMVKSDFEILDNVIQLGYSPVRIDLITSITGVTWDEAFQGKVKGKFGNINVYFIGKNELIKNKQLLGRKQDLADLEALGEV
jgi:hypothetical protein